MMDPIVLLWSFAVFLASFFGCWIAGKTLVPKVTGGKRILIWSGFAIVSYVLTVISYSISLTVDAFAILGLTAISMIPIQMMYEGSASEKVFMTLMAALIAQVSTFMFCGTTDTFLGAALHLFDCGTPYNVQNILLFIGIKAVVYSVLFALYMKFLRNLVRKTIDSMQGEMTSYILVPLVSLIGFYVITLVSNTNGIIPTNKWFLPLYGSLCVIFVCEFIQIYSAVKSRSQALEVTKEKERIGAELNIATQIQADMLPGIFPAFPERGDFDIYASMHPAKEVGGDFYDFFLTDENHIAMVMADVSGKGVPAALFMVIAKTLIKNRAMMGGSPAEILYDVNNQLCEGNMAELFVTVWLGILDLRTGKGIAANAGHEHPVLQRKDGEFELVKYRHSPAVATMEGIRFREHEFEMNPGDKLFIYTDGVPEATNTSDEQYGTDRMLGKLNEMKTEPIIQILPVIREDIAKFVGEAPQFDDITMLVFEYAGRRAE